MVFTKAICGDFRNLGDFLLAHPKTQIIDAAIVCSERHVLHSVDQTLKAFSRNTNIAKSEQLEFLIRISGERQVKNAIRKCTPQVHAIFVSWSQNPQKDYADLKARFKFTEEKIPEKDDLAALEKAATVGLF